MRVSYHELFHRDLIKNRDSELAKQIRKLILRLEMSTSLAEIPNTKKLKGGPNFYRIRLGDYRVGLTLERKGEVTLRRLLHRKEIYRYFP